MMIDAHCHFFSKYVLPVRMAESKRLLKYLKKQAAKPRPADGDALFAAMNAAEFMRVGFENTPEQLYAHMKESYGCDFIAVPLMMDLSYVFAGPKQPSLRQRLAIPRQSVLVFNIVKNAYQQQIDDLVAIKEKMPDRVYPFYSIDPRRDDEFDGGILGQIKKYIGADKPFTGLKLYASLGYSPTDPVLYDDSNRESVYGYCEKNEIPVTIHAALEGFSHMRKRNAIDGVIYDARTKKVRRADEMFKGGIVRYRHKIRGREIDRLTTERQEMLNHPLLWRKVLEKYPRLKLNMAHFGVVMDSYNHIINGKQDTWMMHILAIMKDFPNVYTDLSFFYEDETKPDFLKQFYDRVYTRMPENVRQRVMYGSDYYMISLFEKDLKSYIAAFRLAFGGDFAKISEENPRRFLGL